MSQDTNIRFLEEYKHLEKLCNEIYGGKSGVSAYIDLMDHTPPAYSCRLKTWSIDFGRLKWLRHIRNQLSHDPGSFCADLCKEEDIEWLEAFYERIICGYDPLSVMRKLVENDKKKAGAISTASSHVLQGNASPVASDGGNLREWLLPIGVILVLIILAVVAWFN